jgi:hypothetical protein
MAQGRQLGSICKISGLNLREQSFAALGNISSDGLKLWIADRFMIYRVTLKSTSS